MTYAAYAMSLWAQAQAAPSGEWRIVMQFYATLHATNSVLYGPGGAPGSHFDHEQNLKGNPTLAPFWSAYKALKDLSTVARYKPQQHPMTASQLSGAEKWARQVFAVCNIAI